MGGLDGAGAWPGQHNWHMVIYTQVRDLGLRRDIADNLDSDRAYCVCRYTCESVTIRAWEVLLCSRFVDIFPCDDLIVHHHHQGFSSRSTSLDIIARHIQRRMVGCRCRGIVHLCLLAWVILTRRKACTAYLEDMVSSYHGIVGTVSWGTLELTNANMITMRSTTTYYYRHSHSHRRRRSCTAAAP
ncbi:hypothetical protein BU24DRAFT_272642 [Aaosphaeria arxii CBS 175.79]|uniref:Uncharacterized protein n=1 Tax=Aaosphaeria arxii CBS 175.79 TaxID=1450172 RepID=A0A6A5XHA2_9PLEO|nr:uncharacterized protein BU24DRAFT_272642 [Aaosphaeria arxii CBS 175.79]KAF2012227.1 hypothetical protein BU24DRAFT_272642 [Aaosphaeria arxii CBS 175.79]